MISLGIVVVGWPIAILIPDKLQFAIEDGTWRPRMVLIATYCKCEIFLGNAYKILLRSVKPKG